MVQVRLRQGVDVHAPLSRSGQQTLGGEQLSAKLAECIGAGPCRFYLTVPVTQIEGYNAWGGGNLEGYVPNAYKIASRTGSAAPPTCP